MTDKTVTYDPRDVVGDGPQPTSTTDIGPAPEPAPTPITKSECDDVLAHLDAAQRAERLEYDIRFVDRDAEPETPPGWRARCRAVPMTSVMHSSPVAAWGACAHTVRQASLAAAVAFLNRVEQVMTHLSRFEAWMWQVRQSRDLIAALSDPRALRIRLPYSEGDRGPYSAEVGDHRAGGESVPQAIERALTAHRNATIGYVRATVMRVQEEIALTTLDPVVPSRRLAMDAAITGGENW